MLEWVWTFSVSLRAPKLTEPIVVSSDIVVGTQRLTSHLGSYWGTHTVDIMATSFEEVLGTILALSSEQALLGLIL